MPVNQKELARLAGVSQVTVSRALRGSSLVSPRIRQKVMEASHRCGYYPRSDARAMRSGKFKRIACVVTLFGPKGRPHNTYGGYLDPASDLLAENGYSSIFESFYLDLRTNNFLEAPRLFSELAVDGVLGITAASPVQQYVDDRLAELGAPVVWINRDPEAGIVSVVTDDAANARMLTRHLIDLGHRRIAYLGRFGPHYSTIQRYEGVYQELHSAGYDTSGAHCHETNTEVISTEALLDSKPGFTAIVCYDLQTYLIALQAAARRGLRVPRDLSLCYFASAWELPVLANFPATVVAIPEMDMARTGVRLLLDTIENCPRTGPLEPLCGTLYEGGSTTPPGEDADLNRLEEYKQIRRGRIVESEKRCKIPTFKSL
jgi:DNA-binding LacI/PurR family transcriptional regulator